MSTTVAVAAIVASQNAIAAKEAEQKCIFYMEGYEDVIASTEQKQQYAECVDRVFPKEAYLTNGEIVAAKACVALLIVSLVIGAVKGYKEDGVEGMFMEGLFYPIVMLVAMVVVALSVMGIGFLFT